MALLLLAAATMLQTKKTQAFQFDRIIITAPRLGNLLDKEPHLYR